MTKLYQVKVTFQVTEEVCIDAASPDEAIRKAVEAMDEGQRLVHADTGAIED